MKTNKIFLTSALCMCMMAPTYANIASDAENPTCDNATIGATSGDTNMEAIWGANTINLVYTADGETFTPTNSTANTCTYDQHVVIPTNSPSKLGYTFTGWKVRASSPANPQQTPFDLSTLNPATNGIWYSSQGSTNYCYYYNVDTEDAVDDDCSDIHISDLSAGEWKTDFSYGAIKGEARCSSQSGSNGWYTNGVYDNTGDWSNTTKLSTLTDETGNEGARYCWCRATGYAEPNSSTYQPVSSASWVFIYDDGFASDCANYCEAHCAACVQGTSDFRGVLFGVSSN